MMQLLREILIRVTLAGLAGAAALRLCGTGALREVVRLAVGLLMLLAFLQPISRYELPDWKSLWNSSAQSAAEIEEQNRQTAFTAVGSSIAQALEKSAKAQGFDCEIRVTMETDADGLLQIGSVKVWYSARDSDRLAELQALLTEACGVPAERQEMVKQ